MALNQDHVTLPKTPFSRTGVLSAAETAFHSPTPANLVELISQAENTDGARVARIYGIPRAAVGVANNLQLYAKVGGSYVLIESVLMAAVTPSASVANSKTDFGYTAGNPLELGAGLGLYAGMGQVVTNGVVVRAEGAFYAQ